jgi:hypothetical protein
MKGAGSGSVSKCRGFGTLLFFFYFSSPRNRLSENLWGTGTIREITILDGDIHTMDIFTRCNLQWPPLYCIQLTMPTGACSNDTNQQYCESGIFIPDPDFYPSRISDPTKSTKELSKIWVWDPGFRGQKGTGSWIWIGNTPKQKTPTGARSKRYRTH